MLRTKKIVIVFTALILTLFTTACTSNDNSEQYEKILEKAPEEPRNIEDITQYPKGPLADKKYENDMDEIMEVIKTNLPSIKNEVDQEYLDDWWRAYHYLFAEDYPDPSNIFIEKEFEPFTHQGIEEERYRFKEQINVLVVLDVSGSMASIIDGKPMIDIAKDSIQEFISNLPQDANVGLRVYGHEGKATGASYERSCTSTELVYDIQPYDKDTFEKVIEPFEPIGYTPLALSLERASEDFSEFPHDTNTNLIYVVSDGLETCDGDPVSVAKSLSDSQIQPIINVIGFNVDSESKEQLQEISKVGKGTYASAGNEEQLNEVFNQVEEVIRLWEQWKNRMKEDAVNHRDEQMSDIFAFSNEWSKANANERTNLFYVINELRNDGYITEEAHSYFATKRSERYELYRNLQEDTSSDLIEQINQHYIEMMEKIEQSFQENTGSKG